VLAADKTKTLAAVVRQRAKTLLIVRRAPVEGMMIR
jgi:hypothetical protein